MAIRIAHISDLHFGMKRQKEVWDLLSPFLRKTLKPALVLVTGDIADSAESVHFEEAAKALKDFRDDSILCHVCPGNHDRHLQGLSFEGTPDVVKETAGWLTRAWQRFIGPTVKPAAGTKSIFNPTLFEHELANIGVLVQPGKPEDIELDGTNWRLRLLVLDSSLEAQYLAQGFVTPTMLGTLRQSARHTGKDLDAPDLVIALVHHHLLPVSALERDRQTKAGLFASTVLVNAGTVLETLVELGADVALHGHEHCRHLARFGTIAQPNGDLVVLGAASATGAHTEEGCSFDRSSFNVLELGDDRSVTLLEYRYSKGTWKPQPEVHRLLGAVEIRRARYLRKQQTGSVPSSRVHKQFIFHATRDAVIRQVMTNCFLEGDRFSVNTENWSGTPYFMGGTVELPSGRSITLRREQPMVPAGNWRFRYEEDLGTGTVQKTIARRVEHEIVWLAGGVLSKDDLLRCPRNALGPLRTENQEFVEFEVMDSLEALTLSIDLPDGFAPPPDDFSVLIRTPGGDVSARKELADRLRFTGRNRIGVSVPYPLPGYKYLIAWRVPDVPPVANEFQDARARLEGVAAKVAEAAHNNVRSVASGVDFTVGVYVPEIHNGSLSFRAVAQRGQPAPPPRVTPTANQNPFCRAHWGVPQSHVADNITADDAAAGLQTGEHGIFALPLPNFFGMIGQSLGIVRVATLGPANYSDPRKMLVLFAAAVQGCASEMLDLVR